MEREKVLQKKYAEFQIQIKQLQEEYLTQMQSLPNDDASKGEEVSSTTNEETAVDEDDAEMDED